MPPLTGRLETCRSVPMLHPDEHDDTAGLPFAGLAIIAAAIALGLGCATTLYLLFLEVFR